MENFSGAEMSYSFFKTPLVEYLEHGLLFGYCLLNEGRSK